MRSRPRLETETEEERTVADGLAMFADPAIGRARDLLDRTADWQPDIVVREIYESGGIYVAASLHVLHGLVAHYPNFIKLAERGLAHVRSDLGEPGVAGGNGRHLLRRSVPPVLQPPDDQPFINVIAMRVGAGEVVPGRTRGDQLNLRRIPGGTVDFKPLAWTQAVRVVTVDGRGRAIGPKKITSVELRFRTFIDFGLLVNGTVSRVLATSVACLLRRTAVCVAIRGAPLNQETTQLDPSRRHDVAPAVLQRAKE
jgi:hypothetical protein